VASMEKALYSAIQMHHALADAEKAFQSNYYYKWHTKAMNY
jgi:hypothetical protein